LNVFLEEIDKGTLTEEEKAPLKGQAFFLRAWLYWELLKYYGGIPLVLEYQDPFKYEEMLVERNSARECIEQIVADLEAAEINLPPDWPSSERGRIPRAAAAALKGRVLLFYASPQFNPDNLQDRWQWAYDANLAAKNLCLEDGFSLHENYTSIFLDEEKSTEALFITVYDGINKSHGYENSVRPRSECNDGGNKNNPTWEFVKDYPMKDGKPIDGHPDYEEQTYWKNRDPRFYATIAYNGCTWELGGQAGRRQWTYINNDQEPNSPAEGASNTGFYCRKNVNEAITKTETDRTPTDWIEIRMTEVLLNLAECAAELGKLEEARNELIAVRKRAGIEAGSDGLYGIVANDITSMVEAVMLERQIELAFENKRHWDLRRRNLFAEDYGNISKYNGTRRHGIQTLLNTNYIMMLDPGVSGDSVYNHFNAIMRDTIDLVNHYSDYFITETDWIRENRDINFLQPKYNFYFIPQSDLDKNEKLQQTILWGEVNPFDPLAD